VQLITAESRILQSADRGNEAVDVLTAGLEKHPGDSELLYARALTAERKRSCIKRIGLSPGCAQQTFG